MATSEAHLLKCKKVVQRHSRMLFFDFFFSNFCQLHSRSEFSKNVCEETARKLTKQNILREISPWIRTSREPKKMVCLTITDTQVKKLVPKVIFFLLNKLMVFYVSGLHKIYVFPVYKLRTCLFQKILSSFQKTKKLLFLAP